MTPIFSMILFLTVLIVGSLILILVYNYNRQQKMEQLEFAFMRHANSMGLSVSTRQILNNIAIGIDKVNSRLLFLRLKGRKQDKHLVNLNEVKSSSIVTKNTASSKNWGKWREIVETVILQLEYKKGDILSLPFYIRQIDPFYEVEERTEKAEEWKTLVTKNLLNSASAKEEFNNTRFKDIPAYGETYALTHY